MALTQSPLFATMRVGAKNTLNCAVAIPTASGNFSFLLVFYGWGAPNRKAGGMTQFMFLHPAHPHVLKKYGGGTQSHCGDDTMSTSISTVAFHGTNLALLNHNEKPFVALKPICESIGIDFDSQRHRIARNPVLHSTTVVMTAVAEDGKTREMVSLPLSMLNGWLFGINANRVKNSAIREKLIAYQFECFDVLNNYWNGKAAIQQKPPVPKNMLVGKINKLQHACEFICGNVGMRVRIPDTLWQSHPLREGDCVYFEYPRGDNPLTSTPIAIHTSKEG